MIWSAGLVRLRSMTLGTAPTTEDLFRSSRAFCEERLSETSVYRLLARESHRMFADETFADLFDDVGRRSIPPRIVATVMVLQRIDGLSDRDAADRFTFDARWKYAAGNLDFEHRGFVHTVLVDMRERLRRSERPDRIFEAVLEVAKEAGLVGRKRVLDSTALYDAVATQDTVTLIRSAIRGLLREADGELEVQLRAVLQRDDDYRTAGKPACEWDDKAAREALVDELARDGYAALWTLDDRKLSGPVRQAAELLATVLGQDLEQRDDGVFRIARRVAPDRAPDAVSTWWSTCASAWPRAGGARLRHARRWHQPETHRRPSGDGGRAAELTAEPPRGGSTQAAEDLRDTETGGWLVFVETKRGRWRVARSVLLDVSTRAAGIAQVSAKTPAT